MEILIVDSNTGRQRQLKTVLSSLGYKTSNMETVGDYLAARVLLKQKRFECCFVAVDSLESEGFSFLADLRSGTHTKSPPVILFSSSATRDLVKAAIEAGITGFLTCPFTASDVERMMKRIEGRRLD